MSVKIAIWSAIIEPGVEHTLRVPRDFTLTNAALGEDLADASGRSVVKLTHEVIPAKRFAKGEGYVSGEDSEEEDEEEDEDEDVEFTTIVVTSLTAGKTEQSTLNLTFVEDEEIIFTVSGSNIVHLSGNYIDQEANQDPDSDDENDFSEDDFSDLDEDEMDDEDEDEDMNASISEIPPPAAKRSAAVAELEDSPAGAELTKSQKKKLNKKLKGENGEAAAAPAPTPAAKAAAPAPAAKKEEAPKEEKSKAAAKKTLASGLVIEDSKLGTGATAKSGKKVGMRYIGKLGNGKVFDSNTNGKPFVFLLGKGEVIKGWDQGVAGMSVGGERKLTIPASLAYGSKALPGIPKNSTLHFEVKLISVN